MNEHDEKMNTYVDDELSALISRISRQCDTVGDHKYVLSDVEYEIELNDITITDFSFHNGDLFDVTWEEDTIDATTTSFSLNDSSIDEDQMAVIEMYMLDELIESCRELVKNKPKGYIMVSVDEYNRLRRSSDQLKATKEAIKELARIIETA